MIDEANEPSDSRTAWLTLTMFPRGDIIIKLTGVLDSGLVTWPEMFMVSPCSYDDLSDETEIEVTP